MLRIAILVLAAVASCTSALAQYPGASTVPIEVKAGFDSVKIADAKRVLTYLATKCSGRGTGQEGFEKAAKFVANEFKQIGLKPLGTNGTYFQNSHVSANRNVKVTFRGRNGSYTPSSKDYIFVRENGPDYDSPILVSGLPVFVDYGGKPGKLPSASKLKGRVIFLRFVGDPFSDPAESDQAGAFFQSVLKAQPSGLFMVEDQFERFYSAMTTGNGLFHGLLWHLADRPIQRAEVGCGVLSLRARSALIKAMNLPRLTRPSPGSVAITAGTTKLSVSVAGEIASRPTENVVGLLEGSDSSLSSEYVVVGGHLDHFGVQDGWVYPGADDDGSGATDVIEVARALAANPQKPKRSVVFVTFFGEEQGLLGSTFFVRHPPVPLKNVVAQLQLDMVGRDSEGPQQQTGGERKTVDMAAQNTDTVRLVGSKRMSTELDHVIRDANRPVGLHILDDAEYVYSRSDHINFARAGIPVCWWFTGFHPDYHQSTDTVDRIDWVKLTSIAKHVYLSAYALANLDHRPVHDVARLAH